MYGLRLSAARLARSSSSSSWLTNTSSHGGATLLHLTGSGLPSPDTNPVVDGPEVAGKLHKRRAWQPCRQARVLPGISELLIRRYRQRHSKTLVRTQRHIAYGTSPITPRLWLSEGLRLQYYWLPCWKHALHFRSVLDSFRRLQSKEACS